MVFHGSLSGNVSSSLKDSCQFSGVISNAVVWIVSTCPLISMSSSPFTIPLVTLARASASIGTIVNFIFHSFSISCKVQVLILLSTFFQFYSVVSQNIKVHNSASSLFWGWGMWSSGCLDEVRWSVGISNSQRSLYVPFWWLWSVFLHTFHM